MDNEAGGILMEEIRYMSPMKAIRLKCLDCMCEQAQEVKARPCIDCSLWRFRLGLNPNTKKNAVNPFLDAKNFIGLEKVQSYHLIKIIEKSARGTQITAKNDKSEDGEY